MAPPPPAIDQVPAAAVAKPRPAVRPVKVARTPGAPKAAVAAKPTGEDDDQEEELLKPKPRATAAAAASDETEDK
jgi:hypothetical protein